jgi:hypothetical protein
MRSINNGAGYFFNDDRCSGGKLDEDDVIACEHRAPGCTSNLMKKSEWKLQGGFCMCCGKPLCLKCYERTKKFGCEGPEVKRFEQAINDDYRRSQNAKVLGI